MTETKRAASSQRATWQMRAVIQIGPDLELNIRFTSTREENEMEWPGPQYGDRLDTADPSRNARF